MTAGITPGGTYNETHHQYQKTDHSKIRMASQIKQWQQKQEDIDE